MLTNPKYSVKQQTLKNSGVCAARHHTPLRRVDTGAINPNSPRDLTGIVERPVTVTGTVTLRLKDVPWDQALDIIMQSKGLGVRKSGNVLWIAPKDELASKEQVDLESRKKIADLEPTRTQSYQLNYTKSEEVAKALSGQASGGGGGGGSGGAAQATRILSPRGSVIFETRTNQLFVTDVPSKLEEIQTMITKIDIPVRQVLIEARIVEADDSFGRALGIKLGGSDLRGIRGGTPGYGIGGDNRVLPGANYNAIGAQTLQGQPYAYSDTQFINLPANTSAFGGTSAATFALSLFGATANRFLNLEISALEAEGRGNIVSSPRVITADQKKASIEQGEDIPYQQATSSGATSVSFKKASLRLEVTPQGQPRCAHCSRARHQHEEGQHRSAGRERRHSGDWWHLHARRTNRSEQGAIARRHPVHRPSVPEPGEEHAQD